MTPEQEAHADARPGRVRAHEERARTVRHVGPAPSRPSNEGRSRCPTAREAEERRARDTEEPHRVEHVPRTVPRPDAPRRPRRRPWLLAVPSRLPPRTEHNAEPRAALRTGQPLESPVPTTRTGQASDDPSSLPSQDRGGESDARPASYDGSDRDPACAQPSNNTKGKAMDAAGAEKARPNDRAPQPLASSPVGDRRTPARPRPRPRVPRQRGRRDPGLRAATEHATAARLSLCKRLATASGSPGRSGIWHMKR